MSANVSSEKIQQALTGRVTYPDVELDECQSDAMGHAYWWKKPDLWWWSSLVLDVADNLLGCLSLVHLSLDPFVKTAFLQGAIKAYQNLNVPVEAGLRKSSQVTKHVVPLPPANPVSVETTIEPVKTILGIHKQPKRTLRWSLPATSNHAPLSELLELHRHYSIWAMLFNVFLETLHTHVEFRKEK